MNAKGIKKEPYNNESESFDIALFKTTLEEIVQPLIDPRAKDNQRYTLFTLLAVIFCPIQLWGHFLVRFLLWA